VARGEPRELRVVRECGEFRQISTNDEIVAASFGNESNRVEVSQPSLEGLGLHGTSLLGFGPCSRRADFSPHDVRIRPSLTNARQRPLLQVSRSTEPRYRLTTACLSTAH
jgi:hypothetical protein